MLTLEIPFSHSSEDKVDVGSSLLPVGSSLDVSDFHLPIQGHAQLRHDDIEVAIGTRHGCQGGDRWRILPPFITPYNTCTPLYVSIHG